jgi:hypothetical protein
MPDLTREDSNEIIVSNVNAKVNNDNNNNGFLHPPPLIVRLICELIGTCLFIFFGAGCATKGANLLTVSVAHAVATIWLVYVFGPLVVISMPELHLPLLLMVK